MSNEGKRVLKALEDLMLFDNSHSSQWPRITIMVEAGALEQDQKDNAVTVWPNGRPYEILRGIEVPVPPEVVDVLYACKGAIMVEDKDAPTGYSPKTILRHQFAIRNDRSVQRYNAWQRGLNVLKAVITETKASPIQTQSGLKMLHEVTARYVPDNLVQDAISVVGWANDELAAENKKAEKAKEATA